MILDETYTLSNGVEIPKLGLGTWFIADDVAAQAVRDAISIGYRNIDTAQAYGNERGVGEGIRTAGVPREDFFVSTKLAAEIKDYEGAVAAIDGSLATMGLDYVDLMLIHSPQPWSDFRGGDYSEGNREVWRALEEAYEAGKIRSIGVSNFLEKDVESLLETAKVVPHVNQLLVHVGNTLWYACRHKHPCQLLVHVGNTPSDLLEYCALKKVLVQAYSPIAHGAILGNPTVAEVAERYGVSIPQLCIRYTLQLGTQSLPKTGNPEHMRDNAQVDFVISNEDMAALRDLDDRDYGEYTAFPVYSGK